MKSVLLVSGIAVICLAAIYWYRLESTPPGPFRFVSTVAGVNGEFGETFGIAFMGSNVFVSDGLSGKVFTLDKNWEIVSQLNGLDTPSGIANSKAGLIVVDSGRNAIYRLDQTPTLIAGVPGQTGSNDGEATAATFNGPIGVAVDKSGKVFIADTYNDRIRVVENDKVSTLAGGSNGFADGIGAEARFNTPTGLAIWNDKLLVADTGNRRIRVVEMDGRVWTLAGNDHDGLQDGALAEASFVQPAALAVGHDKIYVADGNAIRQINTGEHAWITTISNQLRGLSDGEVAAARFNRPSGLTLDANGDLLVADSENRLIRRFSASEIAAVIKPEEVLRARDTPDEFRNAAPGRWPFDPPTAKRDIAGTLGELRGEIAEGNIDPKWFHNGLDIAGPYGETTRFIRDEKVLRPIAVENFDTLRELIRMPTLGYIHIRLGRNAESIPFNDKRFQFQKDASGTLIDLRVPRGAKFSAGEPMGTLNSMNHVHLVAGRPGSEMNALDALYLPGIADTRPPFIEAISFFDENWRQLETRRANLRINQTSKTRVVLHAFDQMDGNATRRRLGVYKLGYQILRSNGAPVNEPAWTISFAEMPANEAVAFVYANGSRSGAKGETIFNYIVTNRVAGDEAQEGFLDIASLKPGRYVLRVLAADRFANITSKDIQFEVTR